MATKARGMYWFATGYFQRIGEGDCTNPRMGQLVMCLSEAHSDMPERYPHMNTVTQWQFRT